MRVIPVGAKTVGDILGNLPIWPAARNGLEHLMQPLDTTFGTRECAFLFQAGGGGENYVGEAARGTEENILHYEEIELGERCRNVVRVGIHNRHFFALQVQGFQLTLMDRV